MIKRKKVDEADELKIVRETKSVEEDQEEVPPKESSTAEENNLTLLNKDLSEESIDRFEEKEMVVNSPDSEEIDFVGKESKAKILFRCEANCMIKFKFST